MFTIWLKKRERKLCKADRHLTTQKSTTLGTHLLPDDLNKAWAWHGGVGGQPSQGPMTSWSQARQEPELSALSLPPAVSEHLQWLT